MPNHVFSLHHVGIVVQNLQASLAWYRDNLGFEHQYDFTLPGAKVTMIVRGDARLELYQVEDAVPMTSERKEVGTTLKFEGANHLGLTVEDLDATINALEAKGVEIVIMPTAVPNGSGDRFAFIRDNDRMLVELFQVAAWAPVAVSHVPQRTVKTAATINPPISAICSSAYAELGIT